MWTIFTHCHVGNGKSKKEQKKKKQKLRLKRLGAKVDVLEITTHDAIRD